MNIQVVGLGLIGGSLCKTIKRKTAHRVFGMDWLIRRAVVYVSYGVVMTAQPRSCASLRIVKETPAPSQTMIQPASISIAQSWDS